MSHGRRFGLACSLFVLILGALTLTGQESAGAYVTNHTMFWGTASANVPPYSDTVIYVLSFPTSQTSPTTVAEETFADPSACLSCIEYQAPAALSELGYWWPGAEWINFDNANYGTVGFLVDFTNQT